MNVHAAQRMRRATICSSCVWIIKLCCLRGIASHESAACVLAASVNIKLPQARQSRVVEQIIPKLREANVALSKGAAVKKDRRQLTITNKMWCRQQRE